MSYEGFVDSEGFDGGDGQVGVVGDGECSPVLYLRSSTLGWVSKRAYRILYLQCLPSLRVCSLLPMPKRPVRDSPPKCLREKVLVTTKDGACWLSRRR